eukprot:m.30502 g.30502  ORF g.30502 m.30502 type:complete len:465 (-) comp4717_c0_seq1:3121-4515(-)
MWVRTVDVAVLALMLGGQWPSTTIHVGVVALDNGLGRVPPMGWSSWNTFVDVAMNETVIRETADAIVTTGLKEAGYEYVNVDCGWSAMNRTEDGDIQPDPDRFPSGMKSLGDYIHARGLKFGLYTARGPVECCGRTGYNGSVHAHRDAAMFAAWGVDYLKIDSCGVDGPGSEWDQFAVMRDALNATGRPVYVSVCEISQIMEPKDTCHGDPPSTVYTPTMWMAEGRDVTTLANSILVEYGNNGNSFDAVVCTMEAQERLTFDNVSQPGSWNDNDMLTVGCTDHHVNEPWTPCINHKNPKTNLEGRSEFTLFVIQASPLILGNDVRYMSAATRETLMNSEVIAINQDPVGHRGRLVHAVAASVRVYVKRLALGTSSSVSRAGVHETEGAVARSAVAVFNLEESVRTFTVQASWLLNSSDVTWQRANLRDVWAQKPAHPSTVSVDGSFDVTLQPHEACLYLATLTS